MVRSPLMLHRFLGTCFLLAAILGLTVGGVSVLILLADGPSRESWIGLGIGVAIFLQNASGYLLADTAYATTYLMQRQKEQERREAARDQLRR